MDQYLITDIHEYLWGYWYNRLIDNYRDNIGLRVDDPSDPDGGDIISLSNISPDMDIYYDEVDRYEPIMIWTTLNCWRQINNWPHRSRITSWNTSTYIWGDTLHCRCRKFSMSLFLPHYTTGMRTYTTNCSEYLKIIMGLREKR